MGVLQRFERRLEDLVEGTFARLFKGAVQPVEVAAALQREAADKKAIVGAGRVLVPNAYVVELGPSDGDRLAPYDLALRTELATMVQEHAQEQGWSFVGPVDVRFVPVEDLKMGVFRVSSSVLAEPSRVGVSPRPRLNQRLDQRGDQQPAHRGRPRLVVSAGGGIGVAPGERVVPIEPGTLVIGRGGEADLNLTDPGISRRHAEVRYDGGQATVVDLSSTNGTSVNGRRITESPLADGDRIGVGGTRLVYRQNS